MNPTDSAFADGSTQGYIKAVLEIEAMQHQGPIFRCPSDAEDAARGAYARTIATQA